MNKGIKYINHTVNIRNNPYKNYLLQYFVIHILFFKQVIATGEYKTSWTRFGFQMIGMPGIYNNILIVLVMFYLNIGSVSNSAILMGIFRLLHHLRLLHLALITIPLFLRCFLLWKPMYRRKLKLSVQNRKFIESCAAKEKTHIIYHFPNAYK